MLNSDIKKKLCAGQEIKEQRWSGQKIWGGMVAGDENYGFYGEVLASNFITGDALASLVGVTEGVSQFSDEPWLKFALNGKELFVAKKTFRHSISYNHLVSKNVINGSKIVTIKGINYKIRLLKTGHVDPMAVDSGVALHGSEWNKLIGAISDKNSWISPANMESNLPVWGINYSRDELNLRSTSNSGEYTLCQEKYITNDNRLFAMYRGGGDASNASMAFRDRTALQNGWRPVLEVV